MEGYLKKLTVTQKIISLGASYFVKDSSTDSLLLTIKGKIFSFTPKLNAFEADSDTINATIKGNLLNTKFDIKDSSEKVLASIKFPLFIFLKSFTLTIDGNSYKAKGGFFARKFSCLNENGEEILTINKEFKVRDHFNVLYNESIDQNVAALAAVIIDLKFFQKK